MHNEKMSIQEYERLVNRFNPRDVQREGMDQCLRRLAQIHNFHNEASRRFLMYDSKVTRMPFRRDVLKELTRLRGRRGLKRFSTILFPTGITRTTIPWGDWTALRRGTGFEKYLLRGRFQNA